MSGLALCRVCGAQHNATSFARLEPSAGGSSHPDYPGIEWRQCNGRRANGADCRNTLAVEVAETFDLAAPFASTWPPPACEDSYAAE